MSKREADLMSLLLDKAGKSLNLTTAMVEEMTGGQGSLKFIYPEESYMSGVLIDAMFLDQDKVPISVQINLDSDGRIIELDIWKVDSSEVLEYPSISTFQQFHWINFNMNEARDRGKNRR